MIIVRKEDTRVRIGDILKPNYFVRGGRCDNILYYKCREAQSFECKIRRKGRNRCIWLRRVGTSVEARAIIWVVSGIPALLHTCSLSRLVALQCWRKRNEDLHKRTLAAWAVQRALGVFISPSETKTKNALLLDILESLVWQIECNEKQEKMQMHKIKARRNQINFDDRDGTDSNRSGA